MGQKKRGSGRVDRCPVSFLLRCGCAARRSIYSAISFFIRPQLVLSTAVGRALPSDHSRDDSLITLPASALPPRSEPDLLRRGPRSVRVLRRASRVATCSSVSRAVNAALCSSLRALCASLKETLKLFNASRCSWLRSKSTLPRRRPSPRWRATRRQRPCPPSP